MSRPRSAVLFQNRNYLETWRALALATIVSLGLPSDPGHSDQSGVFIISSGPRGSGGQWCVNIVVTGVAKSVGVTVEVNGVVIPSTQTQAADGSTEVCFHVSAAAAGGTVTITATAGGSHATENIPILPGLPTPGGG